MFLGLEWYWWLLIVVLAVLSIPLKIKYINWWNKRQQEQKNNRKDKWGGKE